MLENSALQNRDRGSGVRDRELEAVTANTRSLAPILIITRLTFHEARRRRILILGFVLGLAFLALFATGIYFIQRDVIEDVREAMNPRMVREAYGFLSMAGLYVVNFLIIMMAALISVDTLSGEITSGTIQTLVTKPLRRWQVVLGKWLGFTTLLLLYLALMAGGVILIVRIIGDYTTPNILSGLGLMALAGALVLTLSILGGTRLSTLANGVLVFGLYGLAFVGGWIEQIGALMNNETVVNIGVVSSLIMPSEALWRLAGYEMQSPLTRDLGAGGPFMSLSLPSTAMVVYAVVYTGAMLVLAMLLFHRRDL
jgi:ABC-type transport system involved in multi-copper enzyme maturation permease subunit